MTRFSVRCLIVGLLAGLAWSLAPQATALADDEPVARMTRAPVRARGPAPTPHLRVVCYDVAGRQIACANSARVARQLAFYGACDGCEPVVLPPSRYGLNPWWFWW